MEDEASKVTASGASPTAVEDESTAVGGFGEEVFGWAVMVVVA